MVNEESLRSNEAFINDQKRRAIRVCLKAKRGGWEEQYIWGTSLWETKVAVRYGSSQLHFDPQSDPKGSIESYSSCSKQRICAARVISLNLWHCYKQGWREPIEFKKCLWWILSEIKDKREQWGGTNVRGCPGESGDIKLRGFDCW